MSEQAILDSRMMARALQLAYKGLYTTEPNPRVGCVLVLEGEVVGEGWHVRAGEGHAEVNALAQAGSRARGATAYVTLEPCSHIGKTPPCAEALIEAGVARVVAAMQDPNPLVSGQGLARLREAGIEVECGLLEVEARALNPGFIKRMQTGMPFVRIKLAMSLDGRTAMASGESQWITGPDARAAAAARQPLRVLVDGRLRVPLENRLFREAGPLLVACRLLRGRVQGYVFAGAELLTLPDAAQEHVDLKALLQELAKRGCNEVLVESGASLAGAFLNAGLVDEIVVYMAPRLLGSRARPLLELPFDNMAEAMQLDVTDMRVVGRDWRITARPVFPS